ncbi:MAG: FAD-dependent thymidylate synthase [Alphaproteobacteria bacterium]|nr:FAD-dependent thymidylate synthase [Alphaproteobacteria bacterium]
MNVKLVGVTAPVAGHNSAEDMIVYMARVSNPSNQNATQGSDKLIRYLIKNQHWSPFQMVNIVMEINVTRDIARQILRHRSFSFQEFSQRYADPTKDLNFELREARLQDTKNRQNSIEIEPTNIGLQDEWIQRQLDLIGKSNDLYKWALNNGIAKEQARAVLPEGNTLSRLYVNGTLRSWIHYIELRSGNGTQKEHRELAVACAKAIEAVFPMITSYCNA